MPKGRERIMELLEEKIHIWTDSARYVKAKPGAFVLYDRKQEPIFIGNSQNLQKQFSDYLDSNFHGNPCMQKTHSYQRIFIDEQTQTEKSLLAQFKEKYGRLPECNSNNE